MDRGLTVLAAKYIRRQSKQLAEQLDGACAAGDVEFVHRARVASRRLRTALEMFRDYDGKRRRKAWQKEIRRLTTSLGEARDKDVQIAFLSQWLSEVDDPACYAGLARLLVALERQRDRMQRSVAKAARRIQRRGVLRQMQRKAKRLLLDVDADEVSVQTPIARVETEKSTLRGLKELLSYQDSLTDAKDQVRHHAMRIAAKGLRYTLEIANPVYSRRLEPTIDALKKLQTLMGELHDCDVWLLLLDEFAAGQRKQIERRYGNDRPFARLEIGLERFRDDRRARRQEAFIELSAYWAELKRQRVWDTLVHVLESAETIEPPDSGRDPSPGPRPHEAVRGEAEPGTDLGGGRVSEGPPQPLRSRNEPADELLRRSHRPVQMSGREATGR
jgi:CHAD domain-containing protein